MAELSWWQMVCSIARAILHDRVTRRKWLGYAALLLLGLFAAGLWLVADWLAVSPMRFGVWWLAVTVWTLVVLLFALYDALAVIREERDKMK